MTYSIVALDPATGELGAAVQTRWFCVGPICPWVEPGVGAVSTQSFVEPAYGPRTLARLRGGASPAEALAAQLALDDGRATRQVGIVDATGRVAVHTGEACVRHASHATRDGVSCQANMMAGPTVPAAMLAAFEATKGDLIDRLMAALVAAEAEGGDTRGRQSAALVVAPGPRSPRFGPPIGSPLEPWQRRVDLRVDDAPAPLDELARLVRLARAQEALDESDAMEKDGDVAGAIAATLRATTIAPEDDQLAFIAALELVRAGREDEARPLARRAAAANARWSEHARRLAEAGHAEPAVVERLAALLG